MTLSPHVTEPQEAGLHDGGSAEGQLRKKLQGSRGRGDGGGDTPPAASSGGPEACDDSCRVQTKRPALERTPRGGDSDRPKRRQAPPTRRQVPQGDAGRGASPEGYGTGVVDAHEDGHAAHDAGPLPLKLVGLPQVAVDAGVQQADDSWGDKERRPSGGTGSEPHDAVGRVACHQTSFPRKLSRAHVTLPRGLGGHSSVRPECKGKSNQS